MNWQPLKSVPDPVQLAFCDAVRATVMPIDAYCGIARVDGDMLAVDLVDGRRIHVGFDTKAQIPVMFGARQALRYDLEGRAVVGHEGFGLGAQATIDVKTKAFLDVRCVVLWHRRESDVAASVAG